MAPSYKLYYFDTVGLAEPIKFLFSYGNIEFEDVRIQKEDWPKLKPDFPFGVLPVLEHDGKKVGQSSAIARYVAKKVKLVGNDDWENLEIDAAVDTMNDVRLKMLDYYLEQDEARKETKKKVLFEETLPFFLGRLNENAEKNNGYLVLGRLTWADLYFASFFDAMGTFLKVDLFEKCSALQALKNRVFDIPAIKKWVNCRVSSTK